MLALVMFLINAANQVSSPYSNLKSLDQSAADILTASDEAGILRPVIYLYGIPKYENEYTNYRNLLEDYISSFLSSNIGFTLIGHEIKNGTPDIEYFSLIGSSIEISALESGGEGIAVNFFLGSFTSAVFGQYFEQYLVQLYFWEKF
jgi:hypothetical protein